MNNNLENIKKNIEQSDNLNESEKEALLNSIKSIDKEISILEFKLERTEKVKRTTSVLLEETIDELEKKRQAIEAQNRELEIEAALERVRARTMAMHKSDELAETAAILFQQMTELGVTPERLNICLIKEADKILEVWATDQQGIKISHHFNASLDEPTTVKPAYNAWKEKKKSVVIDLSGKELNDWMQYVREVMGMSIKAELVREHRIHSVAFFSQGMILTTTPEPLAKESIKLLERFADVFNLTYRRFLDLQNAEAQAREAQIEAALEKIRSRSLAMHKSDELQNVVSEVFDQLQKLDFALDGAAFIATHVKDYDGLDFWMEDKITKPACFRLAYYDAPSINDIYDALESGKDFISNIYGKEKNIWFEYAFEHTDLKIVPEDRKKWIIEQEYLTQAFAAQKNSALGIHIHHKKNITENEIDILKRFSQVFEQGYVRFLDLQKAEAQARESQIEAALERVRSRTMGMQKSAELQEVVNRIFIEMTELGVEMDSSYIITHLDEDITRGFEAWVSIRGLPYASQIYQAYLDHPVVHTFYKAWKEKDPHLSATFTREEKNRYFSHQFENSPQLKHIQEQRKKAILEGSGWSLSWVIMKNAAIIIQRYQNNPFNEEAISIQKRFARVFEQAYTRFIDLEKAEAQAKEALKQSSLDRVRGEIASMRATEDLNRITPVIWRELQALEVPFFRCGVFIFDEKIKKVQVYLTTPDGKALGVLNLSFNANQFTANTVEHWRNKQIFKAHWDKEEFINWTTSMMELKQVQNSETYQGASSAPESLNLHFIPFKQGMLYVGGVSPLPDNKIELVKTLAEAFSLAYSRYEDFQNLEQAKHKIELTLRDLKMAQAQLIQSEKMASLGELTAGIAHEIQNPLNFVNNFSELSNELLDELKEEMENGNNDEVKELAEDVIQNLQKINHHGKRAESIIKGMLLHSRGSSAQKEPTDINKLADEYLRLSYHGFRAKDKSFNADFKLEADESLPKINVVPQDFGRVLLNLINNAFYAVKAPPPPKGGIKESKTNYKPTVLVRTSYSLSIGEGRARPDDTVGRGEVKITVSDNGPGIPASIKDKIFQPFFTTKSTGEGTGLGLSISYDIITKGHDGELKVKTFEGEGTEFVILLPYNETNVKKN